FVLPRWPSSIIEVVQIPGEISMFIIAEHTARSDLMPFREINPSNRIQPLIHAGKLIWQLTPMPICQAYKEAASCPDKPIRRASSVYSPSGGFSADRHESLRNRPCPRGIKHPLKLNAVPYVSEDTLAGFDRFKACH